MNRPASPHRATLSALGALALWSSLAALTLRLSQVPPLFLAGVTLLVGGLLGVHRVQWRALRWPQLLLGVYGLFAYHLCLFLGLRLGPPVEVNLINYLWPLLIVVLSPLLLPGLRLRPRHLLGAALGFGGAALLMSGERGGGSLAGHGLALAAAVIWSTYSLLTKRLGGVPTSAVSAFCLLSGALALGAHALLEPAYVPTLADLPWLAVIGVGPMGAAFYLWDHGMKHGDPRTLGTLAYLTPLCSTLLVATVGGEPLSAKVLGAGAAILGGAVVGTWSTPARRA